jgi:hypothetical protein
MMDRKQAVAIQKHLLDTNSATDRARTAITGLGKEERTRLNTLLVRVLAALQSKLLGAIHDQYPDLEPPHDEREVPAITSTLRWS